eukprot:9484887-Pyramimonas_sp.AAC.2
MQSQREQRWPRRARPHRRPRGSLLFLRGPPMPSLLRPSLICHSFFPHMSLALSSGPPCEKWTCNCIAPRRLGEGQQPTDQPIDQRPTLNPMAGSNFFRIVPAL